MRYEKMMIKELIKDSKKGELTDKSYMNWGLTGIWVGLAIGRIIASILNFTYARYTIRKLKSVLN